MLRNEHYARHYLKLCQDPEQYVIMDNGAAEDETFNTEQLLMVMDEFHPDEMVIPDTLGDPYETYIQISKFMRDTQAGLDLDDVRVAFVAQGKTVEQAFKLVEHVMRHKDWYFDAVHIPRLLVNEYTSATARLELADAIHKQWPELEIHLLGAAPSYPMEAFWAHDVVGIRGMDTSMPYNYAWTLNRVDVDENIKRPENYFDLEYDEIQLEYVRHNINVMQGWIDGA